MVCPRDTVTCPFALDEVPGADYIGEPVPGRASGWLAAALAEADGCEKEVILAAFFPARGPLCA